MNNFSVRFHFGNENNSGENENAVLADDDEVW